MGQPASAFRRNKGCNYANNHVIWCIQYLILPTQYKYLNDSTKKVKAAFRVKFLYFILSISYKKTSLSNKTSIQCENVTNDDAQS